MNPAAVVERLVSSHGPWRQEADAPALLEQVRSRLDLFEPAIRSHLTLPADPAVLDGTSRPASIALGRALALAQALGKERGAPMVRDFHNALRKRLSEIGWPAMAPTMAPAGTAPVPSHVATLRHLERGTLDVLGAFEDPTAIAYALDTIDTQEPATRTVMLRYLAALAKHDPTIRQRLRTIVDRPTSPLNQNPFARSVLDSMATTQPAATTNPSSTMDEPSILHIQPGEDRATRQVSLSFEVTGVWRYDPTADRWDALAQATDRIAVAVTKSPPGTAITLDASEVIGESDVGLFYITWSLAEKNDGSIVYAGRILPNDIDIEDVPPGKVAVGVPFPDHATVRVIPDPRLHCIPGSATTRPQVEK